MLPPGYAEHVPDGYIAAAVRTPIGGYALLRSNLNEPRRRRCREVRGLRQAGQGLSAVAGGQSAGDRVHRRQGRRCSTPPSATTCSFFEGLDRIVQSEPWLDRDRAMIDQLKSLGIEKGKPFDPDARDQGRLLEAGVREAQALAGGEVRRRPAALLRGTHWTFPAPPGARQGGAGRLHRPERLSGRCARPRLQLRLCRHQAPGRRPVLPDHHQGQGRRGLRRRQDLPPDRTAECAGRAVLVGDGLRPRRPMR